MTMQVLVCERECMLTSVDYICRKDSLAVIPQVLSFSCFFEPGSLIGLVLAKWLAWLPGSTLDLPLSARIANLHCT